jgi:hypothetical protein
MKDADAEKTVSSLGGLRPPADTGADGFSADDALDEAPAEMEEAGAAPEADVSEQLERLVRSKQAPAPVRKEEASRMSPEPAKPGSPPAAAAPAGRAAGMAPGGPRRLKATVVLFKDGKLFLEIAITGLALAWRPRTATLTLATGGRAAATIIAERTTLPITATEGMSLTLALDLGAFPELPKEVTVMMDGEAVTLEL